MMNYLNAAIVVFICATPGYAEPISNQNIAVAQTTTRVTNDFPINSAWAPTIATANNCALGASGGLSTSHVGISFGRGQESRDCVAQNAAQMALALSDRGLIPASVVVGTACQNSAFAAGMAVAGKPCPQDLGISSGPRAYSKCERRAGDGQIVMRPRAGANVALAVSQCRTALNAQP